MEEDIKQNDIIENNDENNETKVIETDAGNKDGQNKCPKCGATDISLNVKTGKLRCNFCRHEFDPQKLENIEKDIENLEGRVIGSGSQDIEQDANEIVTLKCTSCGAEVVIDTSEVTQARCHWCRNTLSINEQVPNGAVPDMVLPFKLTKQEARDSIEQFVGKRKFFAHPKFRKEFTTENVMGVYLPYMVVDINGHSHLSGQGEIKTGEYTETHRSGNTEYKETFYDADLYDVKRDFDITIEGLTVESSTDKLENNKNKTNNIINSIMPFDTENAVKWDANYIKGYTSEKRDTNIEQLENLVHEEAKDIARHQANSELRQYDRGVRWTSESLDIKGEQWRSAYLPVWLYSYLQEKGSEEKNLLHYVAVNARTKETMGSVPIHMPKLIAVSALVELLGGIAGFFGNNAIIDKGEFPWVFVGSLSIGLIYYFAMHARYRNSGARDQYEIETKATLKNMKKSDIFVRALKRLKNPIMEGANNKSVSNRKSLLKDIIK